MKRKKHTPQQIIRKLREAEALLSEGKGLAEVCWAAPQKLIQAL